MSEQVPDHYIKELIKKIKIEKYYVRHHLIEERWLSAHQVINHIEKQCDYYEIFLDNKLVYRLRLDDNQVLYEDKSKNPLKMARHGPKQKHK